MNFYVPLMAEESQLFWNVTQSQLFIRYRFTTDRRVRALLWQGDEDDPRSIRVGHEMPGDEEGNAVMTIHESSFFPDMLFVSTLGMFLDKEDPVAVAVTRGWLVVDFDDSPGGEA